MTGGAGSYNGASSGTGYASPIGASISGPDGPRSAFDRWALERDRPSATGAGAQKNQAELLRNLANPAPGEIASGASLNAILDGLAPFAAKLKTMPPTPIDAEFVKRLNFARGANGPGLLRQQGKIDWPSLLMNLAPKADTAEARRQVEGRLLDAFNQVAAGGAADAENVKALHKSILALRDMASGQAQSMTFAENVEVKRYLNALEDSAAFLKLPDAADWLPGQPRVVAGTLQELVLRMMEKKMRFAPAPAGKEASYTTTHQALATLYSQAAGTR